MESCVSTHDRHDWRKTVKDVQAAPLGLVLEIAVQQGQKIRGMKYSMCLGSH